MLPFVFLMLGSGIWNFRQRAAEGLWKEPQKFADDDDEDTVLNKWLLEITIVTFLLLFFLLAFFFNPRPFIRFFSQDLNIPIVHIFRWEQLLRLSSVSFLYSQVLAGERTPYCGLCMPNNRMKLLPICPSY